MSGKVSKTTHSFKLNTAFLLNSNITAIKEIAKETEASKQTSLPGQSEESKELAPPDQSKGNPKSDKPEKPETQESEYSIQTKDSEESGESGESAFSESGESGEWGESDVVKRDEIPDDDEEEGIHLIPKWPPF